MDRHARIHGGVRVFVTEPWPAIYVNDAERLQTFATSPQWFEQSTAAYAEAGCDLCVITPCTTVRERAGFVLDPARSAQQERFSMRPAPFSRPAGHSTDTPSRAMPRLQ